MLMENSPNADLEVCFYDGESRVYVGEAELTVLSELMWDP